MSEQSTVALAEDSLELRVYWEDTDAGGIVYYANYLKFAERGRTELVRKAGIDQSRLLAERGLAFAVRRCTIDYRHPAILDDILIVTTQLTAVRGASLDMRQRVVRTADRKTAADLDVRLACLDRDGRPARLPDDLRGRFAAIPHSSLSGESSES